MISVALSSSGGLFATGSGDCKARIWRLSVANSGSPPTSQQPASPNAISEDPGRIAGTDNPGEENINNGGEKSLESNSTGQNVLLHTPSPSTSTTQPLPVTTDNMETGA